MNRRELIDYFQGDCAGRDLTELMCYADFQTFAEGWVADLTDYAAEWKGTPAGAGLAEVVTAVRRAQKSLLPAGTAWGEIVADTWNALELDRSEERRGRAVAAQARLQALLGPGVFIQSIAIQSIGSPEVLSAFECALDNLEDLVRRGGGSRAAEAKAAVSRLASGANPTEVCPSCDEPLNDRPAPGCEWRHY